MHTQRGSMQRVLAAGQYPAVLQVTYQSVLAAARDGRATLVVPMQKQCAHADGAGVPQSPTASNVE
jgi:hypothetical protein